MAAGHWGGLLSGAPHGVDLKDLRGNTSRPRVEVLQELLRREEMWYETKGTPERQRPAV